MNPNRPPRPPPNPEAATINVNVTIAGLDLFVHEVANRLSAIECALVAIAQRQEAIMVSAQEIIDEVTAQGTIADSILVIVQRLVSENDPAERQRLFDLLKANRAKLDSAVLAGTPQEPTPTP